MKHPKYKLFHDRYEWNLQMFKGVNKDTGAPVYTVIGHYLDLGALMLGLHTRLLKDRTKSGGEAVETISRALERYEDLTRHVHLIALKYKNLPVGEKAEIGGDDGVA